MKLWDGVKKEWVVVRWGDHAPGCKACREVDLKASGTFSRACAEGSPLLMEWLKERQAPVEAAKRKAEEQWAKDRGTFIKSRVKDVRAITKYK